MREALTNKTNQTNGILRDCIYLYLLRRDIDLLRRKYRELFKSKASSSHAATK